MYLFFGCFFLILLFFFCINHFRRKRIIKKICSMSMDEKCRLLENLIEPFGCSYIPSQDIFSTRIDAWQRNFGYCHLYDEAAPYFNMVFDCLPIYFNYQGRTWMIELWKGQYGINSGCEIGVYYADRILEEEELEQELFQCADDENMLQLYFNLYLGGKNMAHLRKVHWWLTAFSMGCFLHPSALTMRASITLENDEMADAFTEGLIKAGFQSKDIRSCCHTVSFTFRESPKRYSLFKSFLRRTAQCMNHFWCRVYLWITRPFTLSADRLLYLYYYLPFAFRKMLRIRKYKGSRKRRKAA